MGDQPLAVELYPGRLLLAHSSVMLPKWPLWLGEVVHAEADTEGRCRVTRVEMPLKMRHYESGWIDPEGSVAERVHGLGGDWESLGDGLLNWLHVPVEAGDLFGAGVRASGRWPLWDAVAEQRAGRCALSASGTSRRK